MSETTIKSIATASAAVLVAAGYSLPSAQAEPEPIIDSIVNLDLNRGEVTLPLFQGFHDDEEVWYIILDASNRDEARQLGVNWAPKLTNALGTAAVQDVDLDTFEGTVDFSPERVVVPNPETAFPPDVAQPGSVGDADYSPLFSNEDGVVFNAPHVANASGQHDRVVDIDFAAGQVTMRFVGGFYDDRENIYISTEASDATTAALEESTYAPNLNAAPGLADNNPRTSARAALTPIVNGETGIDNPARQGLTSALLGEGDPLNILDAISSGRRGNSRDYSPLWDVHPIVWTDEAIASGQRELLTETDKLEDFLEDGLITSGGFGPPNPRLGGLRAAGFIVNCPILASD